MLFKLLAKAAMRLRKDGFQASGMSIRVRFVGLEHRFERDMAFAPIDDTSTFLHQLGEQMAQLKTAIQRGRWNPRRNPPLSVAVTLMGLQQGDSVTRDLMVNRQRDRDTSRVVDRINPKYGNNSICFGAMQQALAHDAAPMRIPFSQIPETAREKDIASRRKGGARKAETADEPFLKRDRQFKALAENAHREAQKRKRPSASGDKAEAFKAGAGGWNQARKRDTEPAIGETRPLF